MGKNNEKRLCWNCDGSVSYHLEQCPYCTAALNTEPLQQSQSTDRPPFNSLYETPSPTGYEKPPYQPNPQEDSSIPPTPYSMNFFSKNFSATDDEWNSAFEENRAHQEEESEEDGTPVSKNDMIALMLLLPGVVFFLFGAALFFFSKDGVLSLSWNQNFAYFYFLGAIPLLFLGWRALR